MRFSCPACDTKYSLKDEKVRGLTIRVRCRTCAAAIVIAWLAGAEAASVGLEAGAPAPDAAPASSGADAPCARERGTPDDASDGAGEPPQEASADGLRAAFEALVGAARAQDRSRLLRAVGRCLRAPRALFVRLFGEDDGAAMSAVHERLAPARSELLPALAEAFVAEELRRGEPLEVEAALERVEEMRADADLFRAFLRPFPSLGDDVAFGFVVVDGLPLSFWIHDDGAWRLLGDLRVLGPQRPTPEGLAARLRMFAALLDSPLRLEAAFVAEGLTLPSPEAWFGATFGAEAGPRLAGEYREWLDTNALGELGRLVQEAVAAARAARVTDLEAEGHLSPYTQAITGLQRDALLAMSRPVPLFTASLCSGVQVWSFAFVDGGWRWLGKMRALSGTAPTAWTPAEAYAADEPGLARFVLDTTHRAARSSTEDDLRERCAPLLLPDAHAWFSARVGPAVAASLAPPHEDGAALLPFVAQLALGECFRVEARRLTGPDDPEATTEQRVFLRLAAASAPPLHAVRHEGPHGALVRSSWTYEAGAWRLLPLGRLAAHPTWRERLRYPWPEEPASARFPPIVSTARTRPANSCPPTTGSMRTVRSVPTT